MAIWDKIASSGNVEDRRGSPGGGIAVGGVGGFIILLLFVFLGGGDPASMEQVLNQALQQQTPQTSQESDTYSGLDPYESFVGKVLGSNNEYWKATFALEGKDYTEPKLVLFRNATSSACGAASSSVGPHYCPLDQTIYIDETFFDQLQRQFGGSNGDVAQAYVISHEVGHHIQNLQGTMQKVVNAQQSASAEARQLGISLELQADCYAGLWINSIDDENILQPGEIEEALSAASAVGDDRVQQKSTGSVNPETWTHGSSKERVGWFTTGFNSENPAACNTFNK